MSPLAPAALLLLLAACCLPPPPAAAFAVKRARRRAEWDKNCILLCHAECSVWKGYELKHCASQCMVAGLHNFQQEFCFNLEGRKRADYPGGGIHNAPAAVLYRPLLGTVTQYGRHLRSTWGEPRDYA